jgi:hypothetical protein
MHGLGRAVSEFRNKHAAAEILLRYDYWEATLQPRDIMLSLIELKCAAQITNSPLVLQVEPSTVRSR